MRALNLVAVTLAMAAAPLSGQVFTPSYMAPQPGGDTGIYISDGPGNFAIEGIMRRHFGAYDLGFRLGVAGGDNARLLVGGEYRMPLALAAPLDFAVTAGAQGMLGDGNRSGAGFQGGLSIGARLPTTGVAITPYLHPRFGLVNRSPGGTEATVLADLGVDFGFPNLIFRIGFGFGDPTASWGMGFAWR
jgi:hypothetical protein